MTIDADGNVAYEARGQGGHVQEQRTAEMRPEQIEGLVAAINRANIWAIEGEEYRCCDLAPLAISVTLNGRSKSAARYDALGMTCRVTPPGATAEPGTALCGLGQTIDRITNSLQWITPTPPPTRLPPHGTHTPRPTTTPIISSAKVVVTVNVDQNGDGTPEPSEGLNHILVQLQLPDGNVLSATTQPGGAATFDMAGYAAGSPITASLPNLYRSYQFYLPESGTVPIIFSFAQPTLPGKAP